jgi:hypothetical protein
MELFINTLNVVAVVVALLSLAYIANLFVVNYFGSRIEVQYGMAMTVSSMIIHTTIGSEVVSLILYAIAAGGFIYAGAVVGGIMLIVAQAIWFIVVCVVKKMTSDSYRELNKRYGG